jgi:hypothetical protein
MRNLSRRGKGVLVIVSCAILLLITAITSIYSTGKNNKKGNGGCSGSCAGCGICNNPKGIAVNYYQNNEAKLLKTMGSLQKMFTKEMEKTKSEDEITEITKETEQKFIEIIPEIPYIGGKENRFCNDMEMAAMALAFYRAASDHGMTVDDVGNIINNAVKNKISAYPKPLTRWMGRDNFKKSYMAGLKKDAQASEEKQYEGDWVYTYIEGDNKTFDYGYDFTQCGIVEFFKAQGVPELVPYLCKVDFIYSDALDEGLTRTCTLAKGDSCCNFRYKRVDNVKMDIITYGSVGLLAGGIVIGMASLIRFIIKRRKRIKN